MTQRTHYTLTLECQRDHVDPNTQLKRLLKFAGRVCRMRCVAISKQGPDSHDENPIDESQ